MTEVSGTGFQPNFSSERSSPSASASPESDRLWRASVQAQSKSLGQRSADQYRAIRGHSTLGERLFDSKARCKLKTAEIAMHLDCDWRKRLFAQIDSLLDEEEWDPADEPVIEGSFATFLRLMLHLNARKRPGLGASNGHIIAAWTTDRDRLTVECFPNDVIRWVVGVDMESGRETAAGQTVSFRLRDVLQPYGPDRWFGDEGP